MKSVLLSVFAIAALTGVQAASVDGNNTAVVVRRANTPSASGYQLICVPVKPFDVTGTQPDGEGTIALSELLPPATYTGFKVTLNPTGSSTTYFSDGTAWTAQGDNDAAAEAATGVTVKTGEVLWLFKGADAKDQVEANVAPLADETLAPIVFCGEENKDLATPTANGQLAAIGNALSETKTLADIFTGTYAKGAQISHIATLHDTDYTVYRYYGEGAKGGWKKFDKTGIHSLEGGLASVQLLPGEAVYYYLKEATPVTP